MIKLLSFKTRHPDLTPEAFRSHYEASHVPLGLSFIHHFRWRKYVRNYVVGPDLGSVNFDCMTEFWVSAREDQERTADFVGSPEFQALDEDDLRFLDVARRLSFEVEEHLLGEAKSGRDPTDTRRLAIFIPKPGAIPPLEFAADILEKARIFSTTHCEFCDRIALDLRRSDSRDQAGIQAVLSVWTSRQVALEDLVWPEIENATPVVRLEAVETPAEALFDE